MGFYLKEFKRHIIDASRTDLSDLELLDLNILKSGGDLIYRHLHANIVRNGWCDYPGFPLKFEFHSNKLLACCISIREIAKRSGFGNQKIQQQLNDMVTLEWFYKENCYTRKGQTVYVLGTWEKKMNDENKPIIVETLFRDIQRDKYIKQKIKKTKVKENVYSDYNFDNLYQEDFTNIV